jgi:hypothetical protein
MTAGTALVADLQNFSELSVRRGINVQISNSHSTFFIEGKQAVRCDMRAALGRPVLLHRPEVGHPRLHRRHHGRDDRSPGPDRRHRDGHGHGREAAGRRVLAVTA